MKDRGQRGFIFLAYLGFALLMPILGGMFLGILLVKKFSWPNWIPLLFMGIGFIGGMRDVYLLAQKEFRDRR
jgi:hypothetical protein